MIFMGQIAIRDLNEATSEMLDQISGFIQTIWQLTEKDEPVAV